MNIVQNPKVVFYLLMILAMISWGASWVNAKVISDYISAQELVFYRYLVTVVTLIPVLIYMRKSFKIDIKTIFLALLASSFLILYSIFFLMGQNMEPPALEVLL
ncbi:MAG: EamA family transporter [Campylobacterota bacterium]|nr:EamA family transporter [Campylobacterota bacterium]